MRMTTDREMLQKVSEALGLLRGLSTTLSDLGAKKVLVNAEAVTSALCAVSLNLEKIKRHIDEQLGKADENGY